MAIIGVGRAGLQHARAAELNGIRVVAHASRSADSERSQAFRAEFPESKPFLVEAPDICGISDLVVISVPPEVTHRIASRFIRASRRVLIEKPAALTSKRIQEFLVAERESGSDVMVGYNRRSYPLVTRVREILQIDPPTQLDVTIVEDLEYLRARKSSALQFSYLRYGSASHFLDLLQFLVGIPSMREIRLRKSVFHEGFTDISFHSVSGSGTSIKVSIDAGDRSRRGLTISTASGSRLHLSPLEHLTVSPNFETKDIFGFESRENLYYPNSYYDSFVLQLRKIATGNTGTLHRLDDSLRLSLLIDELELASSEIANE